MTVGRALIQEADLLFRVLSSTSWFLGWSTVLRVASKGVNNRLVTTKETGDYLSR